MVVEYVLIWIAEAMVFLRENGLSLDVLRVAHLPNWVVIYPEAATAWVLPL